VNTYNQVANFRFGNVDLPHCHQMAQVVIQEKVTLVLVSAVSVGRVEVHPLLYASTGSASFLQCHSGKEGIQCFGLDEA